MLLNTILVLIVLVNGTFILQLVRDLIAHKQELRTEPGNPIALAFSQFIIFFLSTFGISDFAIGASLYPKAKWVEDEKLPGTLNTACVVPVAAMALAYISSIEVGLATLLIPIIAQVIGAYISPRFVVKLLCFANLKYIVLQRKVHNIAIQFFPFNYSFFDNAFFKRKLSPVKVNMCA